MALAPAIAVRRRPSEHRRRIVAGLGALGVPDAAYMLAYHEGWIDSLFCPFFGEGCETVARSPHAKHFGVPNAAAGAVAYAAMTALVLADPPPRYATWRAAALGALAGGAALASVFLTWEQKIKVRAWCFWCLSSAVINAAMLGLLAPEVRDGLRGALRLARGGSGTRPD